MGRLKWLMLFLAFAAIPATAYASQVTHVKWFSQFSFVDRPNSAAEVFTPLLIGLAVLSMLVIAALVPLDGGLRRNARFQQLEAWLDARKQNSTLVMRIAMGATLLLSWQADSLLAPDLKITAFGAAGPVLGWAQFVLAALLIFERSTPLAGIGIGVLYVVCTTQFGLFYMLDYVHYVGIALYLTLSNVQALRVRALRLPVLYATVGFALIWLGCEKIVYPDWGLYVLQQNPGMSLGLPVDFFLRSAAFVELSLGYLLIICLFERPLALIITLVFFTTTLVFGKVEVIGHTSVHAALIVFLLNGPGTVYRAPITFHTRTPLRAAFASVNFALVTGVLIALYLSGAWNAYQRSIAALPGLTVAAAPELRAWREGGDLRVNAPGHAGQVLVWVDGAFAGAAQDGRVALPSDARSAIAVLATADDRVLMHAGDVVHTRVVLGRD